MYSKAVRLLPVAHYQQPDRLLYMLGCWRRALSARLTAMAVHQAIGQGAPVSSTHRLMGSSSLLRRRPVMAVDATVQRRRRVRKDFVVGNIVAVDVVARRAAYHRGTGAQVAD